GPGDRWGHIPIADIGSIHRLRWGDVDGDHRLDLVVAPIFGRDARPPRYDQFARLGIFRKFDWRGGKPPYETITSRPILHAIDVVAFSNEGGSWIVTADDLGPPLIGWGKQFTAEEHEHWRLERIFTIPEPSAPPTKRGASEVHVGKLKDG